MESVNLNKTKSDSTCGNVSILLFLWTKRPTYFLILSFKESDTENHL